MARDMRLGDGAYVIPKSSFDGVERTVDMSDAMLVVVYPDSATTEEITALVKAVQDAYKEGFQE